jgi:hypothetical protein
MHRPTDERVDSLKKVIFSQLQKASKIRKENSK